MLNRVALASINTNVDSPRPRLKLSQLNGDSLPLTPSHTPKLNLLKTTSSLTPLAHLAPPARKTESFSHYRIAHGKNVKADLAATKLKLRLQLAFYKLKAQKDSLVARQGPEITVSPTVNESEHETEKEEPRTFKLAANVNLQKPRAALGPSLSSVASKVAKKKKGLRLYHIKPLLAFHNAYPQLLPLTGCSNQRLPPVHKILKTPIKTTTRNLVLLYGHGNGSSLSNFQLSKNDNSDETIDDAGDETCTDVRKKDLLGSSPTRFGTFSTPNSFSVAKSLLQLGLGYY